MESAESVKLCSVVEVLSLEDIDVVTCGVTIDEVDDECWWELCGMGSP